MFMGKIKADYFLTSGFFLIFQDYSEASSRNKQLEHFLQMSLLHQPEKPALPDPLQLQHQQHLMSQFQRNVS